MPVIRGTSWSNDTEVVVSTTPVRLKAVECQLNPAATSDSFIQIFNDDTVDPGTDLPVLVLYVPTQAKLGKALLKYDLRGVRLNTACSYIVTTTATGETAATTDAPYSVQIFYDPA